MEPKVTRKAAKRQEFDQEKVLKLKCPEKGQVIVWDEHLPGFGVRLSAGGSRRYVALGRVNGAPCFMTFGTPSELFDYKKAKLEALGYLIKMEDGIDPKVEKIQSQRSEEAFSITLQQIFDLFKETNTDDGLPRRAATLEDTQYILNSYLEGIRDKPVALLTKEMCETIFVTMTKCGLAGLRKLRGWHTPENTARRHRVPRPAPTAANNVMRGLHALVEYARKKFKDTKGNYAILAVNPVAAMRETTKPNKKGKREGRIQLEHIGPACQAFSLKSQTGRREVDRTGADFLSFCLETGMRPSDASKLCHDHIDFENNRINAPEWVMKTGEPFIKAVNHRVRELLLRRRALHVAKHGGRQDPPDDWVFPSPYSASGHIEGARTTFKKAMASVGEKQIIPYDQRRTYLDVAMECEVDGELCKRLMAHSLGVQGAYNNKPEALVKPEMKIGQYFATAVATSAPPSAATTGMAALRQLTRAELADLVWQMPSTHVAKKFGITDTTVKNRCKALHIPKPERGYWRKVQFGTIDKKAPPIDAVR